MRLAARLCLVFALGAAVLAAGRVAPAPSAPSRVIDRTLLCETGTRGGIRKIDLYAASAIREGPQEHAASVDVRTNRPNWLLAYVGEGAIQLSPDCTRWKASVPLTSRGLFGGLASVFEDDYDCATPRRLLIRVRAVFDSPVTLRRGRPYGYALLFARGKVKEGALAVRTQLGKPLVFATVSDSGKARVFTAGSCV